MFICLAALCSATEILFWCGASVCGLLLYYWGDFELRAIADGQTSAFRFRGICIRPFRDIIQLSGLAWESADSCRADYRPTNVERVDFVAYVDVSSVYGPVMDDLAIFLEENSGWTHDIGSVDYCLVNMWR